MSQNIITFDPNNLPEVPTAVFDTDGIRIGTFNPHTHIIHPTNESNFGPMKLLGRMAFDMSGQIVGKFNENGHLSPEPQTVSA